MNAKLLPLILLIWLSSTVCKSQSSDKTAGEFEIQINKNVELLGFVYFLGYEGAQAETSDYSPRTKARYAYGLNLYRQYKSFENSKNLAVAVGFAQDIWLDYFITLLVQLDDFPHAKLHDDIDPAHYLRFSSKKDTAEAKTNAVAFIAAMNGLWQEVDFDIYLKQNRPKYANAIGQVKSGLPDSSFISTMEKFYQAHLDSYILVPSLTIPPGMGFGIRYSEQGKKYAFHVFGAFHIPNFKDSLRLDMGFDDQKHLLELSTHEFGHSFVNPVIDKLPGNMISETKSLFEPIKEVMSNQGYTAWKACVYEHFVRAGEIMISRNRGNAADTERLRKHYEEDRKFIYLPLILAELSKYDELKEVTYKQAVRNAVEKLVEKATQKQGN
ncbi:DUF4932 domain-containing protein [Dyadobacter aurulentus]|uniref:DUF4932 domain-containing protein n=1 Tax=Dyadobacter sp. UC 10 TaxID=2605428 RepID=UPI0011F25A32|nr:DUF4932 domain-containing protein [Dyadobacter sp. UC 10]KAA0993307.1 DUF4932 domain-containing protein [Dyadobacter sp. UC 10]